MVNLPLVGLLVSGRPIAPDFSFPPKPSPVSHPPFSWYIFTAYLSPAIGVLALLWTASRRPQPRATTISPVITHPLPWWGWSALIMTGIFWIIAWTRQPWFAPFQHYSFTPLWLAFIVFVNAICFRRSGKCPLLDRPFFFFLLFPTSAVFWWYFEYLNQYVNNWHYTGVDFTPRVYVLHASLSFSTVLPAVYTTHEWLMEITWLKHRFHGLPVLHRYNKPLLTWLLLLIPTVGLLAIPTWPHELFPMLWIAPLLLLSALQRLSRRPTFFAPILGGDWRPVITAAMAALICGFFWEMWNYYSLAKWSYSIPYLQRFQIFEMPILGYLGYIPFGLECMAVVGLLPLREGRRENHIAW